MENLLISRCLLGENVKYNGKNNYNPKVEILKKYYNLIPICPEVLGGLSIPRIPSEIILNTTAVINKESQDVTKEFTLGAKLSLDIAKKYNVKLALLKDGSPSCGSSYIYDGTFTSIKVNGYGITTRLLIENNIKVYNENEIDYLIEKFED